MKAKATLTIDIRFDPKVTDAESVASALDTLLSTAMSTPDVLDECGDPTVGAFFVSEEEIKS